VKNNQRNVYDPKLFCWSQSLFSAIIQKPTEQFVGNQGFSNITNLNLKQKKYLKNGQKYKGTRVSIANRIIKLKKLEKYKIYLFPNVDIGL